MRNVISDKTNYVVEIPGHGYANFVWGIGADKSGLNCEITIQLTEKIEEATSFDSLIKVLNWIDNYKEEFDKLQESYGALKIRIYRKVIMEEIILCENEIVIDGTNSEEECYED